MRLLLIGHLVFQMGKKTSQEAPLCGNTSKAWKPFTHMGLLNISSATSAVLCSQGTWMVALSRPPSSSCMFPSAWSCEGPLCNAYVMHHLVIDSFLYIVYTSTTGMFHANFNHCRQTIGGGEQKKKKLRNIPEYNLVIQFLCLCQDLTDFRITILWMRVCKRKVNF